MALESQSGVADSIATRTGHACWVGEGRDRALRLDGYSVWLQHSSTLPSLSQGLTIAVWLALESYPVDEAAIIEITFQTEHALRLSVDKWGFLKFSVRQGKTWNACQSASPIPRYAWTHLAIASDSGLLLNGVKMADCPKMNFSKIDFSGPAHTTVARSADSPVVAGVFPTAVLNGLIKDLQVWSVSLPEAHILEVMRQPKPEKAPDLQLNRDWCIADSQRPGYHAMPPRAWTNEPHGLVYWHGEFHLFYQKNPNGPYWGHINWGHLTSPDLSHWTEREVALCPEPGPDAEGCWSGSAIEHDGKLALIYTGGDGHRASICLALSSDGIKFEKHPGNPIIPEPPRDMHFPEFRDPFVWRENDRYYLIIGSAVKHVGGTALLYRSTDLIHWEFLKPLLVGNRETSGVFWEMPVFVKAGDHHALVVCEVPGRASYWVGKWENETFTPFSQEPTRLELFNHLLSPTPHVASDGRVIAMGIIPDQRSPKECWQAGWAHLYSLPRVWTTDANGHLHQTYLESINQRTKPLTSQSNIGLPEVTAHAVPLASGTRLKLQVTLHRGDSRSVSLLLRRSADGREQTELRYEWEIGRLVLDRTRSSLDSNVKRDEQQTTFFSPEDGVLDLTVFLDESVIEVFAGGGYAFATRVYPTLAASQDVLLTAQGTGARAAKLEAWQL